MADILTNPISIKILNFLQDKHQQIFLDLLLFGKSMIFYNDLVSEVPNFT